MKIASYLSRLAIVSVLISFYVFLVCSLRVLVVYGYSDTLLGIIAILFLIVEMLLFTILILFKRRPINVILVYKRSRRVTHLILGAATVTGLFLVVLMSFPSGLNALYANAESYIIRTLNYDDACLTLLRCSPTVVSEPIYMLAEYKHNVESLESSMEDQSNVIISKDTLKAELTVHLIVYAVYTLLLLAIIVVISIYVLNILFIIYPVGEGD